MRCHFESLKTPKGGPSWQGSHPVYGDAKVYWFVQRYTIKTVSYVEQCTVKAVSCEVGLVGQCAVKAVSCDVLLPSDSLADLEQCESIWNLSVGCECHKNSLLEGVGAAPVGGFMCP